MTGKPKEPSDTASALLTAAATRDDHLIQPPRLPTAVPAWQVLSENRTVGHFEALRSGGTPLVGRDEEMELLLRRWAQAKVGNGRVILISAEPRGR